MTWLDPTIGLDLSAVVGMTFNAENPTTDYRTGKEFHVEWAAVQHLKTGDSLHHGKFAESPGIVQLIGQRLMTGQTLTDSNISLGQGVAAVVGGTARTVGTVAGAAVAAPLVIIEQPARRQQPTGTELEDSLHNDRQSKPLSNSRLGRAIVTSDRPRSNSYKLTT